MRSAFTRTSAALAVVCAATLGGLLSATPAQAADGLEVNLQLPDLVDGIGSAMWTPNVDNTTNATVEDAELTITLSNPKSGKTTVEIQSYGDERCTVADGGAEVTCTGVDLKQGVTDFGMVLSLRSGADAVKNPEVYFDAVLRDAKGVALATDSDTLVVRHDAQPRLELDAATKISADADSEAKGVKWTMTVHNNTDSDTFDMDTVNVDLTNADGESRLRLGAGKSGCALDETGGLSCPLATLAPGEDKQYELVLWVDKDKSKKDTATLQAVIPQTDADDWAQAKQDLSVKAHGTSPSDGGSPAADTLPKTGSSLTTPVAIGAGLLVAAGVLLVATRRRTSANS